MEKEQLAQIIAVHGPDILRFCRITAGQNFISFQSDAVGSQRQQRMAAVFLAVSGNQQ